MTMYEVKGVVDFVSGFVIDVIKKAKAICLRVNFDEANYGKVVRMRRTFIQKLGDIAHCWSIILFLSLASCS
jgi:hypothetical protein